MDKRGKVVISVLILFIALVGISSYFVLATETNTKSYDSSTKTITVSKSGTEIAKVKLDTPLVYNVMRGKDRLVAEFTIDNYASASNIFNNLEFYDVKNNMNKFDRDFNYKYKTYDNVEVPDYETICKERLSANGTTEKYDCVQNQIGTHTEQRAKWNNFNKDTTIPGGSITLGIFTDVLPNERVEWVPTFYGVKITEWAVWTESMTVGLIHYWDFDNDSGTNAKDIRGGDFGMQFDGTLSGNAVFTTSGKRGKGIYLDGNGDSINITNYIGQPDGMEDFTISMWLNVTGKGETSEGGNNLMGFFENNASYCTGNDSWCAWTNGATGMWWATGHNNYAQTAEYPNVASLYNFAVFTGNFSDIVLYFNGSFKGTATRESIKSGDLYFGFMDSPGWWFHGVMDEIGIWNRSLTPSEASDLWNNGNGIFYTLDLIPPNTTQPTITPSQPNSSSDLQCYANLTDDKQANITAIWKWYKNNVSYSSGTTYNITNNTNWLITTLPAVNIVEGDKWVCEVKPFDGTNYGDAKNSTAVTILTLVTFNVTDSYYKTSLDNVFINCNSENFSQAGDTSNTYGPYGFLPGNYQCEFAQTDLGYFNKTIMFTINNDTTIHISMSKKAYLTVEEHTWLEAIYNCLYSGDCSLYNLLLEMNQSIGKIWEQTKPTDETVITFQNITNTVVDSSHNLTIDYIVNVPIKAGYSIGTFLPIRIGFWFLNASDNRTCFNQGDKPTGVEEPYCQPLIVETLGPMGGSVNFTVKLQPELPVGDYLIKRIIDIDPNNVWINYGQETIGSFVMAEGLTNYGIALEKTGEVMPLEEGLLQNIKTGITGAVTGFKQLLSGWQIVAIFAIIGGILITLIISKTIIKLKKK